LGVCRLDGPPLEHPAAKASVKSGDDLGRRRPPIRPRHGATTIADKVTFDLEFSSSKRGAAGSVRYVFGERQRQRASRSEDC